MSKDERFIVSISYGDYTIGTGGTDRVILAQQETFNNSGVDFLFIYPFTNFTKTIKCKKNDYWGLVINGKHKGIYNTAKIIGIVCKKAERGAFGGVILHHMMNVNLDEMVKILNICRMNVYLYIHDYMTICKGGLAKNDREFCDINSNIEDKCVGCKYGCCEDTIKKFQKLFKLISDRLLIIAPSETAKKVWIKSYPQYENKVVIIPHLIPKGNYIDNSLEISENEPVKIAFVGYQKTIKGWDYWNEAVTRLQEEGCNYRYYQFGSVNNHREDITEVKVDFKNNLLDMTDKLRQLRIHVVVLWSLLPETYSYTYYESWAANAFIITNQYSGNIANQVRDCGNGVIGDDVMSLYSILRNEKKMRSDINSFRNNGNVGPFLYEENGKILSILEYRFWGMDEFCIKSVKPKQLEQFAYHELNELIRLFRRLMKKNKYEE